MNALSKKTAIILARLGRSVVPLGVLILFVAHLYVTLPRLQESLGWLREQGALSYEEKMRIKWARYGSYFDLMDFVQKRTPLGAIILFEDGPKLGSIDFYFLFPRRILYGGAEVLRDHPEVEYVVIEGDYPGFPVSGEKFMMDDRHGLLRIRREP